MFTIWCPATWKYKQNLTLSPEISQYFVKSRRVASSSNNLDLNYSADGRVLFALFYCGKISTATFCHVLIFCQRQTDGPVGRKPCIWVPMLEHRWVNNWLNLQFFCTQGGHRLSGPPEKGKRALKWSEKKTKKWLFLEKIAGPLKMQYGYQHECVQKSQHLSAHHLLTHSDLTSYIPLISVYIKHVHHPSRTTQKPA